MSRTLACESYKTPEDSLEKAKRRGNEAAGEAAAAAGGGGEGGARRCVGRRSLSGTRLADQAHFFRDKRRERRQTAVPFLAKQCAPLPLSFPSVLRDRRQ